MYFYCTLSPSFSLPINITDIERCFCSGEPGYDPSTLLIPTAAWQQFTPFELQYWQVKKKVRVLILSCAAHPRFATVNTLCP